jgi:hypothetical protein
MKQNIDSNFTQFSTPSQAAPRGANGQAAVASGMGAAAPDRGATAAGGGAKRGRPTDYAPKVIDMLCDSIRRYGLSDSAAAEQQGMSTSTLSRWKQVHPEIGIKLKQARQQIRTFHLDRIMEHSAAENGKGWRASAWILERLFPGDYSPRMKERNAYLNLEERLADKEAHEALDERLRELHEKQAEERAARAAAQALEATAAEATAADGPLTTDCADCTDSERSSRVLVRNDVAPRAAGDCRRDAEAPNAAAELASASEGDSQNSRNSGDWEAQDAPVVAAGLWPVPASASEGGGAGLDDISEGNAQTAHRAVATTTEVREERFYSGGDSHNSVRPQSAHQRG